MIQMPIDILAQFPVRKSRKQKLAFREAAQAYVQQLGYESRLEKTSFGGQNIVIGDPDTAKFLITAHYDTPAGLPFPNLLTPINPFTFILYQIAVLLLMLLPSLIVGFGTFFLTQNWYIGYMAGYFVYMGTFALIVAGPANKNNANDNTSGVVTVLETARTMPQNLREQVCFVLFDLEEAGLVGSAAYRKAHKAVSNSQMVINLDCVGDGDEILLFPMKQLKKTPRQMELLRSLCGQYGKKSIAIREKGFAYFPSDQKHFPLGVGIAAFRRNGFAGLYCSRIHTHKDTVLEITNVNILRAALTTLIGNAVNEERNLEYETV
jgi:hypothetical protein